MKRWLSLLFLVSLILSACASASPTPAPYSPDTPSPAIIDAPLIESPSLISVRFVNSLDGWGVTETQIVRTNDGGITWYNVTPPALTESGYSVYVSFLDAAHAWVQVPDPNNYPHGGTLYRTADGGLSWTSANVPFSSGDIRFLDANGGWATVLSELRALRVLDGAPSTTHYYGVMGATGTNAWTNTPYRAGEWYPGSASRCRT